MLLPGLKSRWRKRQYFRVFVVRVPARLMP